jgi:thiamine pyrophosphokinase
VRDLTRSLFIAGADLKQMSRDLRVAVDGGLLVFRKMDWKPHFAVGDWDSLGREKASALLRGVFHLTLPRNKDRSDLYYACRAAISAGATDLVCLGVTGGRPDHQLAMYFDLSEIAIEAGPVSSVMALDNDTQYRFLSEKNPQWSATLKKGQTVSIFALEGEARGVTLQGFRFPLKNAVLQPSSHGLSNQVVNAQCSIRVKKGRLLVMVLNH